MAKWLKNKFLDFIFKHITISVFTIDNNLLLSAKAFELRKLNAYTNYPISSLYDVRVYVAKDREIFLKFQLKK